MALRTQLLQGSWHLAFKTNHLLSLNDNFTEWHQLDGNGDDIVQPVV